MTPEPTDGIYKTQGTEEFLLKYGYADKTGREDRINFGGVHKAGSRHASTNLEMQLIGFDIESGKIRNSNGRIAPSMFMVTKQLHGVFHQCFCTGTESIIKHAMYHHFQTQ